MLDPDSFPVLMVLLSSPSLRGITTTLWLGGGHAVAPLVLGVDGVAVAALARLLPVQLGGSGEDALQSLALEVPHAAHRPVVLAHQVVEDHAGPLSRGELGLPEVRDDSQLHSVHPHRLSHRVVPQDFIALFGDFSGCGGLQGSIWRQQECY